MLTGREDDYVATIPPQEPAFVIRATDRCIAAAMNAYAAEAIKIGASPELVRSVLEHRNRCVDYQQAHGSKVPDL